MSRKSTGISAERELIHFFWKNSWAAIRIAGSGSVRYPSPDILAGNSLRKVAVECKSTRSVYQYFTLKEIEQLKEFAAIFGAEPWVAVKFKNVDWFFISLEDLKMTGKHFSVSLESAKRKGLLLPDMIS